MDFTDKNKNPCTKSENNSPVGPFSSLVERVVYGGCGGVSLFTQFVLQLGVTARWVKDFALQRGMNWQILRHVDSELLRTRVLSGMNTP